MSYQHTDEEGERFRRLDYEHRGRWQINWDSSAQMLKRAADLLFKAYEQDRATAPPLRITVEGGPGWEGSYDVQLNRVYYMLMGLSIENLVKSIIIVNHPDYLTDKGLTRIDKHETHELLNENGITEFKEYDDILKELVKYVTYKGKYPVSKSKEEHEIIDEPIDLKRLNDLYNALYKRSKVERRLEIIRKKCNKTFREFTDAQEEIVEFIAKNTTMNDIRSQYPKYSKDLIIHVLEDYAEVMVDGDAKKDLLFTVERWRLGYDDEKLNIWVKVT